LAGDGWKTFGQRSIPTTAAFSISIEALDDLKQRRDSALSQFMEIAGETFREQEQEIRDALSAEEKQALETAEEDRTEDQLRLVANLYNRLTPKLANVARRAPGPVRLRAIELSAEITALELRITKAQGHRNQTNYDYWTTLTKAEQEDRTVQARRLLFEAELANADADVDLAIAKYEEAFQLWAQIFDDYEILLFDELSDDLMRSIRRYTIAIDRETFEDDFPLAAFYEVMNQEAKAPGDYQRVRAEQLARINSKQEAEQPVPEDKPESSEKPEPAESPESAEQPETAESSQSTE